MFMRGNQATRLLLDQSIEDLKAKYSILEVFNTAADTFIKQVDGEIQLWAASRDWFLESWGRDTFIALPGILLIPGRFHEAKSIIRKFASFERKGLIPNRIRPTLIEYNTVDASMWFFQAIKAYYKYTHDFDLIQEVYPVLKNIITHYIQGTTYMRYGRKNIIRMDPDDCLIKSPPQATWMDADPLGAGQPITPRNGKVVEINALWYANLQFYLEISNKLQRDQQMHAKITSIAEIAKDSFNRKFWNPHEEALYDVIEGDPHKGALRPNMIFAVSHGDDLLNATRQMKVVNSAWNDLLTPGGLRTLSPRDSYYQGDYDTYLPPEQKDIAYHQGTVWPWLIGPYCDALARVQTYKGKESKEINQTLARILSPLVRFCMESPFKSLPEVFSGNPPYLPGGTTSQAWSVAEVLRILVEYKIIEEG
jgi:predicted glycogen debranching enzyme